MLIRKEPAKGDSIDNCWSITMLNTELKILVKALVKRSVRVADGVIEET